MKKNLLFTLFIVLSITVFGQKIPFQGKLIESGIPVDGTRDFVFSIATPAWSETHTGVTITDGLYFVTLGSINPLPDSLFYGVDEQQLFISVNDTALSPVILYKPLSTPFEGSDISLTNSEGKVKARLFVSDDSNGGRVLKGKSTGNIGEGFRWWEGDAGADLPFLSYSTRNSILAHLTLNNVVDANNDTTSIGYFRVGSTDGFRNVFTPDKSWMQKDGKWLYSLQAQNWNGQGYSGYLDLRGPNGSTNVVLGSKDDDDNSGKIDLNNAEGKEKVRLAVSENTGNLSFSGRTKGNISAGFRFWEGEAGADLPVFTLSTRNILGAYLTLNNTIDANNDTTTTSYFSLRSSDNHRFNLTPHQLFMQKDGIFLSQLLAQNWGGLGYSAQFDVRGPSTINIEMGSRFSENPDLPIMKFRGSSNQEVILISSENDPEEAGYIYVAGNDGDYWTNYSANGISSSGDLNIHNNMVVNGTVTESSDKRFKKNIQSLTNNLQKIQTVKGVSYNWRQDEFPQKNFSTDKQIGVIAQELEAQFPELVKTGEDGYKSVNYNGFTAVLLEAVKELNAKVEKLESENTQLKAELSASAANATEIEQLKTQMDVLVKMVQGQQAETVMEANASTPGLK